jgi:hypothetical protein
MKPMKTLPLVLATLAVPVLANIAFAQANLEAKAPIVINVPKQDAPVVNVPASEPKVIVEGDPPWFQVAQALGSLAGLGALLVAAFALKHSDKAAKAAQDSVATMREQIRDEGRAQVIAYLDIEPSKPLFYFVVKNLGRSPARNVRISSDASFPKKWSEHALWVHAQFPMIAPGQELRSLMSSSIEILGSEGPEGWPKTFTTTIIFDDGVESDLTNEFQLSFEAFEGISYTNTDIDDIRKALQGIAKSVDHFYLRHEVENYIWKFWLEFLELQPQIVADEVDGKQVFQVKLGSEWPSPMTRWSKETKARRQRKTKEPPAEG